MVGKTIATSYLAFATILAAVGSALGQSPAAEAEAELRSWPQVIDMLYQPGMAVPWIIGVKDDGTKRYGLAMSACDTIKQHGAADDSTVVRIVDFSRFMASGGNARGASLGSVECKTYEHRDP